MPAMRADRNPLSSSVVSCRSKSRGAAHRSRRGHPRLRLARRRLVCAGRALAGTKPRPAKRIAVARSSPSSASKSKTFGTDSRRARPPRPRGHGPEPPEGPRGGTLFVANGVRLRAHLRRHAGGPHGTGARGTPTPTGRFAITDKLRGSDFSASAYGCCILALSGHQTSLPRGWTGGDRLAIHGGSTAGAVSTGCLHAAARDLVWLMRSVPLGAQIAVHP
jgi:hypothetical protein